jgi:hypothetical protein
MSTARSDTYAAPSGTGLYAGMPAPNALPAWFAAQPVGQFFTAPNSAVSSVASHQLMNAYSCTVLAENEIWAFGGGHGASADNTVASYDLVAGTGWVVRSTPTPVGEQVWANNSDYGEAQAWWGTVGARKPNPPHTYTSGVYMPQLNQVCWLGNRGIYNYGGETTPRYWLQFKRDTNTWVQPEDPAIITNALMGRACIRLPSGKVLGAYSSTKMYEWDTTKPVGSQVTEWASNNALDWGGYGQFLHDEAHNRLIRIGSVYSPGGVNVIVAIDLTTKAVTNIRALMTGSSADLAALDALNLQDTPGACIDPINNRVIYPTGLAGGSFYAIDLDSYAVSLVSPPTVSGHAVSAKANANAGIFGRIHFHAGWNALIYNPAGAAQTCLLRLA